MMNCSFAPTYAYGTFRGTPWRRFLLVLCFVVPGCALEAPVYGLKPLYPEARLTFDNSEVAFVPVDSLQPTLRWEPFPPWDDRDGSGVEMLEQAGSVSYDLRIWRAATEERPAEAVYEREGLPDPCHRLERRLDPETRYFWSIRARIPTADGYRVSEWSKPQHGNLRRSNIVPEVACYRFETPAAGP